MVSHFQISFTEIWVVELHTAELCLHMHGHSTENSDGGQVEAEQLTAIQLAKVILPRQFQACTQ